MREDELAVKYNKELQKLAEKQDMMSCFISVPLSSAEFKYVDIDLLKVKLKEFGLFAELQRDLKNRSFTNVEDERFFISLFPLNE